MDIVYKRLTENELSRIIKMRIDQLTEEYTSVGRTVPEDVDLETARNAGKKILIFGDFSYYWIADRTNRTLRRLNELYAQNDQVGFIGTQRVDGKLILPEAMKVLELGANG